MKTLIISSTCAVLLLVSGTALAESYDPAPANPITFIVKDSTFKTTSTFGSSSVVNYSLSNATFSATFSDDQLTQTVTCTANTKNMQIGPTVTVEFDCTQVKKVTDPNSGLPFNHGFISFTYSIPVTTSVQSMGWSSGLNQTTQTLTNNCTLADPAQYFILSNNSNVTITLQGDKCTINN